MRHFQICWRLKNIAVTLSFHVAHIPVKSARVWQFRSIMIIQLHTCCPSTVLNTVSHFLIILLLDKTSGVCWIMAAHVLSGYSNQWISDLLCCSPPPSFSLTVFPVPPLPFLPLLVLFLLWGKWDGLRGRKREVSSGEGWSAVMTGRQRGDYCAILSRVFVSVAQ